MKDREFQFQELRNSKGKNTRKTKKSGNLIKDGVIIQLFREDNPEGSPMQEGERRHRKGVKNTWPIVLEVVRGGRTMLERFDNLKSPP